MEQHDFSKPPKKKMDWKRPVAGIAAVVIIGGVGFYSGMTYQKHQKSTPATGATTAASGQKFGSGYGGASGGFRNDGSRIIGQVTAVSSTSITVQENGGSSKTLSITSSTTITDNGQSAAASDIAVGDTVFITANTSDTSQAARILLNPSFGGGQSQPQSDAQTQSD